MKKKLALKTNTFFEQVHRRVYPRRQRTGDESPEKKASTALELPPISDPALSDSERLCKLCALWDKAKDILDKSASTDPAFRKYLTDWLKRPYATTCWSMKSGAEAFKSNRRLIQLLPCGLSQDGGNKRPFVLCIAKKGAWWGLFVAEKRNRFWKGKSADWFRCCQFTEATVPLHTQVIRALTKLQTREGLYRVTIASHFWAHYD